MFEKYGTQMMIRSDIIIETLEDLEKRYSKKRKSKRFYEELLNLLREDNFLVLDPSLIDKVYNISTILFFSMPKEELNSLRKQVFKELSRQTTLSQIKKEEVIEAMIETERQERNIPQHYKIEQEDILEMYKRDFENYMAVIHQDIEVENMSLFYYLTTVNKIFTMDPSRVKINKAIISLMITKLKNGFLTEPNLEEYIFSTEDKLYQEENKMMKTIKFPTHL